MYKWQYQAAQATDSQLAKIVVQYGKIDTSHKLIKNYLIDKFDSWFSAGNDWTYPAKVFVALHYTSKVTQPISCTYFKGLPNTQDFYCNPGNQRLIYGFMQNKNVECLILHDEDIVPEFLKDSSITRDEIKLRLHSQSHTPVYQDWDEDKNWRKFVQVVFQKHVTDIHGTLKIYYKNKLIIDVPNKYNTTNKITIINTETPLGVWESLEYLIKKQEKIFQEFSVKNYLTS